MVGAHPAKALEPEPVRYGSLDVLRGLTIALMVVVNSPGSHDSSFAPLRHAQWNGFTLTDLVFPTFLFVVGNAMSFTLKKREIGTDGAFLRKVFTRTIIVGSLGILLNGFFLVHISEAGTVSLDGLSKLRLVCVLERIAAAYCIASLLLRYGSERTAIVFSVVTLLGYWAVLYFFGDQPDPYSLTANAVPKLDLMILGTNHIWHGEGVPFDPEGILSSWPSIVNVLGGYFAGRYIQQKGATTETVVRLILAGILLITIALAWDVVFPINKKIWTSSYVLITLGWDSVAIAVLIAVIEIAGFQKWTTFFEIFGRNPIVLYIASYCLLMTLYIAHTHGQSWKSLIYDSIYLPLFPPKIASLMFALSMMISIWMLGYLLYRKKIYLKI
jgi:predicted acyltransferase